MGPRVSDLVTCSITSMGFKNSICSAMPRAPILIRSSRNWKSRDDLSVSRFYATTRKVRSNFSIRLRRTPVFVLIFLVTESECIGISADLYEGLLKYVITHYGDTYWYAIPGGIFTAWFKSRWITVESMPIFNFVLR